MWWYPRFTTMINATGPIYTYIFTRTFHYSPLLRFPCLDWCCERSIPRDSRWSGTFYYYFPLPFLDKHDLYIPLWKHCLLYFVALNTLSFHSLQSRAVFASPSPASLALITAQYTKIFAAESARISSETTRLGGVEASNAVKALAHVFSQFFSVSSHSPSPDTLIHALTKATSVEVPAATVIVEAFFANQEAIQNGTATRASVFSLGKVVGLDWKLGMAISSSNCKRLSAPYVTLIWSISKY